MNKFKGLLEGINILKEQKLNDDYIEKYIKYYDKENEFAMNQCDCKEPDLNTNEWIKCMKTNISSIINDYNKLKSSKKELYNSIVTFINKKKSEINKKTLDHYLGN